MIPKVKTSYNWKRCSNLASRVNRVWSDEVLVIGDRRMVIRRVSSITKCFNSLSRLGDGKRPGFIIPAPLPEKSSPKVG